MLRYTVDWGSISLKRSHGIMLATIVAIIVSLTLIIITLYYYNNQILHQPATAIAAGVDKFGIAEIYPTKQNGREWFVNMQDPMSDEIFNTTAKVTREIDGSWRVNAQNLPGDS